MRGRKLTDEEREISEQKRREYRNRKSRERYAYRKEHNIGNTLDEIIEESRQHLLGKFGPDGPAREKVFFDDPALEQFFADITKIASDEKRFREEYIRINKLG